MEEFVGGDGLGEGFAERDGAGVEEGGEADGLVDVVWWGVVGGRRGGG